MSTSRSTCRSRRPSSPKRKPATQPDPRPKLPPRPWVVGGIDYGPAITAAHDLAAWALDVAERDVAGWPTEQQRVRNARRFVLARLAGKRVRRVPFEDVIFTASLLARIFEDELHLGISDAITILDALNLPTEVVPLMSRTTPSARRTKPTPSVPSARVPRGAQVVIAAPPLRLCDACGYLHEPGLHVRFRSAA